MMVVRQITDRFEKGAVMGGSVQHGRVWKSAQMFRVYLYGLCSGMHTEAVNLIPKHEMML